MNIYFTILKRQFEYVTDKNVTLLIDCWMFIKFNQRDPTCETCHHNSNEAYYLMVILHNSYQCCHMSPSEEH